MLEPRIAGKSSIKEENLIYTDCPVILLILGSPSQRASPLRAHKHYRCFMPSAHAYEIALFASNNVGNPYIVAIALAFSCDVLICGNP